MIVLLTNSQFVLGMALMAGLLPVGLSAQLADGLTPVTREEVWQAVVGELGQRGVAGQQLPPVEDLDLPAAPPARAGRKLQVASACWDEARQHLQFRLQCAAPDGCLPFLAYLSHAHLEAADLRGVLGAGREDAACRVVMGPRVSDPSASRPAVKSNLQPASQPTMRPGDPAIAVFTGNGMRMTASVTCLDRGREGETVRVRGPDGNVFRARISGPATLEVSLR
jgi:hypothetical protein